MGLNSGIAGESIVLSFTTASAHHRTDAHNLAWKLAQCHSSPDTHLISIALHTYESERRPVALRNCARAVEYGSKVFGLLKALGTTDPDVTTARRNMVERLADPAWDARIAEMVADQAEQFDCVSTGFDPWAI
jgi:2-polyprenyl-6-methoxyphenol hydroxylase-like FAD-dependent oxidoreductase